LWRSCFDLHRHRFPEINSIFTQREIDQIVNQPLPPLPFTENDSRSISLGSTTVSDTVYGGPVIMLGTVASIDFTAGLFACKERIGIERIRYAC